MIQNLIRNEGVVDHLVVLHAAEAAVLHAVVELMLQQRALQESAHPLDGPVQVLTTEQSGNTKSFGIFFVVILFKFIYVLESVQKAGMKELVFTIDISSYVT